VSQVENYLDLISMYKINTLHLHLSDNDGWRIDINGWPRLARYGGSTDASRGPGGFLHAGRLPGNRSLRGQPARHNHSGNRHPRACHAAQASYAELNCDGVAPPLLNPGWSSLCVPLDINLQVLDDVIGSWPR